MNTIRAFIAVHLPKEVKDAMSEVAHALIGRMPSGTVRWVRPQQMHLTLRFLGDTAVDKLPAVMKAMDTATARHAPFVTRLDGVSCFPNPRRPRVIWVSLYGDTAQLAALKSNLDERLTPLGWPPENRPFRAHLTLGRVKDERGAQGVEWTADVPCLEMPVGAIHLIESQLRPDGPVYTARHTSYLAVGQ